MEEALRILVVDDSSDAATSLALLLRINGHEVRIAGDGLEAVEAAGEFRPDVALLDVGLPRMSGHEAARRIREHDWGKAMILIAVTGWGRAEDRVRSRDAGCDHHLVKPVDPAALLRLLSTVRPAASPGAQ